MEAVFFTNSKKKLYELSDELNLKFIYWFQKPDEIWNHSISQDQKILKDYFSEICYINNCILNSLEHIKKEIYLGKINNKQEYFEADFKVVEIVLRIYMEFNTKKNESAYSEIQDLKQIIIIQQEKLFKEIERFPDDFATNVKSKPGIITTIQMDYFQMIYLAFMHAQHQLSHLKISKDVWDSMKRKSKEKIKTTE